MRPAPESVAVAFKPRTCYFFRGWMCCTMQKNIWRRIHSWLQGADTYIFYRFALRGYSSEWRIWDETQCIYWRLWGGFGGRLPSSLRGTSDRKVLCSMIWLLCGAPEPERRKWNVEANGLIAERFVRKGDRWQQQLPIGQLFDAVFLFVHCLKGKLWLVNRLRGKLWLEMRAPIDIYLSPYRWFAHYLHLGLQKAPTLT